MTALSDHLRAGAFVVSEAPGSYSREQVTILGGTDGGVYLAGTVMGKLTSGGKYVPSPNSGADGSQTAAGILFDDVDSTDGDVVATIITRMAEVRTSDLLYDSSVNDNTKIGTKLTQLAATPHFIIAR